VDPFRRFAVFTLARDASFVALAASTLMVGFSFAPALAFGIAAYVALIFSVVLALRALLLTDERFRRSEVWQALEPHERPDGEAERQWAQEHWKELLLRSAKTAAACAITLYSSSLVTSWGGPEPAHAVVTAVLN
jgi:hypothetical protein